MARRACLIVSGLLAALAVPLVAWAPPPPALAITVPGPITTNNDPSKNGAIVAFTVTASGGTVPVTISCSRVSGSFFLVGTTTVTCTATDSSGPPAQVDTKSFTVTVLDNEGPVITAPDLIVPTDPGKTTALVNYLVQVKDNVTANVVATCAPKSGTVFPLGTTTVTCTAEDAVRNKTTTTFRITVVDREPPRVTPPGSITTSVDPGAKTVAVAYGQATASDNVGVVGPVTCAPASGTLFTLGTSTVTCTAKDAAGNVGTGTFSIVVRPFGLPSCTISGTFGPDRLIGTDGSNYLCGLGGADRINGRGGEDTIKGGEGPDVLTGGRGRDLILAGRGNDVINAADNEFDAIRCGGGVDRVTADAGDDVADDCEQVS